MKKTLVVVMLLTLLPAAVLRGEDKAPAESQIKPMQADNKVLMMYDFEKPDVIKDKNVSYGTWELHPSYISDVGIIKVPPKGKESKPGNCLLISYDVSMPEEELPYATYPVYNGAWFKLNDADISGYNVLSLEIKGDPKKGFTSLCKLEIKNNFKEIGRFYIYGISGQWKRYEIPLRYFVTQNGKPMENLTSMKEFTIVFEKNHVSNKKGVVYVDNIAFERSKKIEDRRAEQELKKKGLGEKSQKADEKPKKIIVPNL